MRPSPLPERAHSKHFPFDLTLSILPSPSSSYLTSEVPFCSPLIQGALAAVFYSHCHLKSSFLSVTYYVKICLSLRICFFPLLAHTSLSFFKIYSVLRLLMN